MAISTQEYWRGFARQREALPPGDSFYLISIASKDHTDHKPGVVVQVKRELAAKCLFEATHRLADEEEINEHLAKTAERDRYYAAEEVKRKQQFALPKELNDLVIALAANAKPQPEPQSKPKRGE
jgi:hypothetical protein